MESKTTHIDMKKMKIELLFETDEEFRRYHESGDNIRLSKLISMLYLVNTCANELRLESEEILERYKKLKQGKIKTRLNNLEQSFESYNLLMVDMLGSKNEAERRFSLHYEEMIKYIRDFMDIDGERDKQNADNQ